MKIGIDIDDTLIDTKKLQLKLWKKYYNNNKTSKYTSNLPPNINEFGDEYINKFWDTYREELSFTPPFKKDVSKYLHKLKQEQNTICIVTSRPKSKYKNLEKRLSTWFKENNIPIDIIYTDVINKGEFCKENNIDILIDDDIKHIKNANKNNIKTILFNKSNQEVKYQTTNWKQAYEFINIIKKEQN